MSRKGIILRLMLILCFFIVAMGVVYLIGSNPAEEPANWTLVSKCLPDGRKMITFLTRGQIRLAATFHPPCQEEQYFELGPDEQQEFTTGCSLGEELGIALATWKLNEKELEVWYFSDEPCVVACQPDQWLGEHFNNARFEGNPIRYTCDDVIDQTWTEVPPEGLSVRWTRKDTFGPTSYLFRFEIEGGEVALREDDGWFVDPNQVNPYRLPPDFLTTFDEGEHTLTVEFSAEEAPARILFDYELYRGEPVHPGWQIKTMTL